MKWMSLKKLNKILFSEAKRPTSKKGEKKISAKKARAMENSKRNKK